MSAVSAFSVQGGAPNADAADVSGQVLRWVSESLRALICKHIPELSAEASVVFESPAEIETQGQNKLSLYLYQIEQNPWLRNTPPTLDHPSQSSSGSNTLAVTPAPMTVDLIYMMVPYAKTAELELVITDKLIRLFHNVGWLQGPLLHKGLEQAGNSRIQIVPRETSFDMLRDMWAGFPGKPYKFTKLYMLSPVRIPTGPASEEYIVAEVDMSLTNTRPLGA
jgi:hypothetical protein